MINLLAGFALILFGIFIVIFPSILYILICTTKNYYIDNYAKQSWYECLADSIDVIGDDAADFITFATACALVFYVGGIVFLTIGAFAANILFFF